MIDGSKPYRIADELSIAIGGRKYSAVVQKLHPQDEAGIAARVRRGWAAGTLDDTVLTMAVAMPRGTVLIDYTNTDLRGMGAGLAHNPAEPRNFDRFYGQLGIDSATANRPPAFIGQKPALKITAPGRSA